MSNICGCGTVALIFLTTTIVMFWGGAIRNYIDAKAEELRAKAAKLRQEKDV